MHQENGEDGITRANNIVKRRKEIWREESLALLFLRVTESILACSCAQAGYFSLQKVAICNFFSFPFFWRGGVRLHEAKSKLDVPP
jgi:hypothetical protein